MRLMWEPRNGEILSLQRQRDNVEDKVAVAVMKSGSVVGHKFSTTFLPFYEAVSCNKAYIQITGSRMSCGAGHGLEVPCMYPLRGLAVYLQQIKALLEEAAHLTSSS